MLLDQVFLLHQLYATIKRTYITIKKLFVKKLYFRNLYIPLFRSSSQFLQLLPLNLPISSRDLVQLATPLQLLHLLQIDTPQE